MVFTQAFVDAMRPTMALAIAVILVAAVTTLAGRNRPNRAQPPVDRERHEAPSSAP